MPTLFRDKVTVNGVEFNTAAGVSAWPGSIHMSIDGIPGWRETAELDVITTKIGFADGEISASRYPAQARHLMLEGYVYCVDRATAESLMDELLWLAFPVNQEIELVRHEPIPKSMTVRVSGRIEMPQPVEEGFRFQVPIIAPDPHKYSLNDMDMAPIGISGVTGGGFNFPLNFPLVFATEETGQHNVMVLTNDGNAPAPFVATLTGPLEEGWRIENTSTGDILAFEVGLGSADVLVIDTKRETSLLNDSSVAGLLVGDFFRLQPRGNALRLYGQYNPDATLSVSAKSAWRN